MLKGVSKEKMMSYSFKLTPAELKLIKQKANKYTKGNVSHWVRYSAVNLDPKREDLD